MEDRRMTRHTYFFALILLLFSSSVVSAQRGKGAGAARAGAGAGRISAKGVATGTASRTVVGGAAVGCRVWQLVQPPVRLLEVLRLAVRVSRLVRHPVRLLEQALGRRASRLVRRPVRLAELVLRAPEPASPSQTQVAADVGTRRTLGATPQYLCAPHIESGPPFRAGPTSQ